ncbi:dipeptidase [uncultured Corynebacterium sp.]|uniref:dipeptidase n=1 Tax=uncultured Corynebacterium sp. TaxID=159447 RepID=UPI0025E47C76|nr:dipeptidase [uncultured Corynebacterium sp.]
MNSGKRESTDPTPAAASRATTSGASATKAGRRGKRSRTGLKVLAGVVVVGVIAAAVVAAVGPGIVEKQSNPVADVDLPEPSAEARELHGRLTIADMHSDALLWKRSILDRGERGHVDLPRLQEGNVALQVFASVTRSPRGQNLDGNTDETDNITPLVIAQLQPPRTWFSPFERSMYHAEKLDRAVEGSDGQLRWIRTKGDLDGLVADREAGEDVTGVLFALEGLHNLEGDPANLKKLYDAGARMAGFTHFFDNEVGGSMHGVDRGGLTDLGRDMFAQMQDLGMVVDLAHSSPAAIDEMLAMADGPVVNSHGGVRATCDVNRNLSDEQIRGIAETGGVIGVGYWEDAVCGLGPEPVVDAIDHVVEVAGIDAAALGSDFDGSVEVPWDTSQLAVITQELMNRGYSEEDIAKIMGGNTVRVLGEVLPE